MTNPTNSSNLEYLVVGHVTCDLTPDGGFRVGGTATYAALAAYGLGARVGVLTSAEPSFQLFSATPDIQVARRTALQTTTFENIYVSGHRQQYVRAVAAMLTGDDMPPGWECTPIVHLGPVAQEIAPSLVDHLRCGLLGVTPQGWLRHWDEYGLVSPAAWLEAGDLLARADAVILSLEDLGGDRDLLTRYIHQSRLLVQTVGSEGAIVYHGGCATRTLAYEVVELDPTGAGDVFAAAFLLRLFETNDAIEAARYANSAASFVVEGVGIANVPTREQVEWRLRYGRLRGTI